VRRLLKIEDIRVSYESGFTLLEVVVVIGLIALISTSLGSLIVSQFEMFNFNTKQSELNEQMGLIISNFEKDIDRATVVSIEDSKILTLKLDIDLDEDIDKIVKYEQEGTKLNRTVYDDNQIDTINENYTITDMLQDINFTKNQDKLTIDIELKNEHMIRKLNKEYYLSEYSYIKYE
jgi:prepilin-type N-terminal cleavage/methylation domain-containing protein